MKTATERTEIIRDRLARNGIDATHEQANALRRAEITLHRWAEQECGDGNDYCSWSIERDETTGKPYKAIYPHDGKSRRYPIADRERGALRRVAAVCKALGVHFFHQTDPRGCALYVSREPLTDTNYSRGVGIA
jgi:hypothetical protein